MNKLILFINLLLLIGCGQQEPPAPEKIPEVTPPVVVIDKPQVQIVQPEPTPTTTPVIVWPIPPAVPHYLNCAYRGPIWDYKIFCNGGMPAVNDKQINLTLTVDPHVNYIYRYFHVTMMSLTTENGHTKDDPTPYDSCLKIVMRYVLKSWYPDEEKYWIYETKLICGNTVTEEGLLQ